MNGSQDTLNNKKTMTLEINFINSTVSTGSKERTMTLKGVLTYIAMTQILMINEPHN